MTGWPEEPNRFMAAVNEIGRVKVLKDPRVPMDLAFQISARVQWLRRICIPRLDAELGVVFPVVAIYPMHWQVRLSNGTATVHGAVGPEIAASGAVLWAVRLSAPSLLAFSELSDSLVEGVLAHEFLHYVWNTEQGLIKDFRADNYTRDYQHYRKQDASQAADPTDWLSPRLAALAERVSGPDATQAAVRIRELWSDAGLPVETLITNFRFDGELVLDPHLVERLGGDV